MEELVVFFKVIKQELPEEVEVIISVSDKNFTKMNLRDFLSLCGVRIMEYKYPGGDMTYFIINSSWSPPEVEIYTRKNYTQEVKIACPELNHRFLLMETNYIINTFERSK